MTAGGRHARFELPPRPGTYLLRFDCPLRETVLVGRLGALQLEPGIYLYAGSAQGPGGLRARVGRHLAGRGRRHWHIDALRALLPVAEVWYLLSEQRCEHRWAEAVADLEGARLPLARFGSSDCRCPAHLVWLKRPPSTQALRRRLRAGVEGSARLRRWLPVDPAGD